MIYIAILRGINVIGKNSIKMTDLKLLFESLNFNHVTTYIQSGNIIFTSELEDEFQIKELISDKIEEVFNFKIPVLILKQSVLKIIIQNNPFLADKETNYIHFTFLAKQPDLQTIEIIQNSRAVNEEIIINDNVAYLYCPNGYGKTKLNNTFLEKKLKTVATTRNYKTTNELLRISESIY